MSIMDVISFVMINLDSHALWRKLFSCGNMNSNVKYKIIWQILSILRFIKMVIYLVK